MFMTLFGFYSRPFNISGDKILIVQPTANDIIITVEVDKF